MDHATRHLSSPSPTSSFLFHHSDKSFKSSSEQLSVLLSSETEDSDVNTACFSTSAAPSSAITHVSVLSSNQSDEDTGIPYNSQQRDVNNNEQNTILSAQTKDVPASMILDHFDPKERGDNTDPKMNERCDLNVVHIDNDNDDEDDEDDEDDDDDVNMRNMLSGSSRSSATSMPLLTDTHTHHSTLSFSERISLEEYSPLSLVNDCDNALPMSPTSLACVSHHSSLNFKSSLNNLKMDQLGVDSVGVDVGVVHGVDDVVGDTRSMSPSLLTSSHHHHHNHQHNPSNMWSNSSTAITQNPALLTCTSTAILLSQHSHHPVHNGHHHNNQHQQISSLMQQIEPQSLDEPPPLIGNNSNLGSDLNMSPNTQHLLHRPSSEPPLNSSLDILASSNEIKITLGSAPSGVLRGPVNKKSTGHSSTCSGGRTRNKSSSISATTSGVCTSNRAGLSKAGSQSSSSTSSRSSNKSKTGRVKARGSKVGNSNHEVASTNTVQSEPQHNCKLHLQLNHHKKLKELQQRLFGNIPPASEVATNTATGQADAGSCDATGDRNGFTEEKDDVSKELSQIDCEVKEARFGFIDDAKEEADSSGNLDTIASTTDKTTQSPRHNDGFSNQSKSTVTKSARPNSRRSKLSKSQIPSNVGSTNLEQQDSHDIMNGASTMTKPVKTETAEPDTTTRTSDCLKLADLLTSNSGVDFTRTNGSLGMLLSHDSVNRLNNGESSKNNERNIQHIQLQMNPSLTVVANNNGLIQPINIQQRQPQVSTDESSNPSNQSIRKYQPTTISSPIGLENNNTLIAGAQLKRSNSPISDSNFMSCGDSSRRGNINSESIVLTNWNSALNSNQANLNNDDNSNNNNNNNNSSMSTSIGTHQFAIQVICQDGTSLVLPVSSAPGLNPAISLSAQSQAQLQAILTSGNHNATSVSNGLRRSNSNQQIFPVVTMINNQANNSTSSATSNSCAAASASNSTISGLAASSPTLAALLDAGSNRSTASTMGSSDGQNILSGNLLRKKVVSSALNQSFDNGISGSDLKISGAPTASNGIKKIKLEGTIDGTSAQGATLTIVDAQTLFVTNGNEGSNKNDSNGNNNKNNGDTIVGDRLTNKRFAASKLTTSQQNPIGDNATSMQQQDQSQQGTINEAGQECSMNKQTTKMTSSTGNRQVDPAQPFRCEHCNSTFTRLGNFTRHKKIHLVPTKDGQRFKCDVCSKSFLQRCDLARHLHIHRGTEPHRCNICGKGYIRHSDLVTHQRFHNKEKPFGCPHCSKGFCQRGDLNRHLRSIHLQMKPILCPCCNRKFAKQETLLRHLNTAHRGGNKTVVAASTSSDQNLMTEFSTDFQLPVQGSVTKQELGDGSENSTSVATMNEERDSPNTNEDDSNPKHSSNASAPVASLQAIQATLNRVQQSADPSKTKAKVLTFDDQANVTKTDP